MVAHLWANQSKPSARSNTGNFWFEGPTIYSYRTPIAYLVLGEDGVPTACLRTSRTYSPTTSSKHQPAISSALRGDLPVIRVPSIPQHRCIDHAANLKHFDTAIPEAFARAGRSIVNYDFAFQDVIGLTDNANRYCKVFNLPHPEFTLPAGFEEARKRAADRAERLRNPDPASADRRERERARRLQRKQEEIARQQAEYLAKQAEEVALWRAGHGGYITRGYELDVMLRIKPGHPDTLETSRGATVPLDDAIRAFRLAQDCHAHGCSREFKAAATTQRKVGSFHIDHIDADGTIHAGCHVIPFEESQRLAASLGLVEALPIEENA